MVLLNEGCILGTAGFPRMHVFSLDPAAGEFVDYGAVNEEYEMCYFHSSCIVKTRDGRAALAAIETDGSRPDLYLIEPREGKWAVRL